MSHLQSDIADLRDEVNALGEKLQRQIDDLTRYMATVQDAVMQLQQLKRDELAAVPVPQSLRA